MKSGEWPRDQTYSERTASRPALCPSPGLPFPSGEVPVPEGFPLDPRSEKHQHASLGSR